MKTVRITKAELRAALASYSFGNKGLRDALDKAGFDTKREWKSTIEHSTGDYIFTQKDPKPVKPIQKLHRKFMQKTQFGKKKNAKK